MKKVITYGTFDMFHEGHENMLRRAREYGDYLIVGVTGESYDVGRGKLSVKDSLADRIENVRRSGYADEIIVEEYLGQKISDIIRYGVDKFVIGDDWRGKFDHLNEYCEVVYLERTPGISSTQIREENFRQYHIGIITDRADDSSLITEAAKVSGFRVTGAYSADAGTAEAFSEKYGIETSCGDLAEFLQNKDIVFVNTEIDSRCEYIEVCIDAGRHVIADPPFSLDVSKEAALLQKAKDAGLIIMYNLKSFHTQVFIQLLWMVKGGLIGDVVRVECAASKKDPAIGRLIYELSASALHVLFSLLGTEYSDYSKSVVMKDGKLEFLTLDFSYPDASAVVSIGNNIRIDDRFEVVGTKGTVRLGENWWRADSFEIGYRGDPVTRRYNVNYEGNGFRFLIRNMLLMLEDGRTEYRLVRAEDELRVLEILEAIEDQ